MLNIEEITARTSELVAAEGGALRSRQVKAVIKAVTEATNKELDALRSKLGDIEEHLAHVDHAIDE